MTDLLFVVDASTEIGLGHLIRSVTLAKHLEGEYQIKPTFVLCNSDHASEERVRSRNWSWYRCENGKDLPKLIAKIASLRNPGAVIYDLERGAPSVLEWQAAGNAKTIAFIGAGSKAAGAERLTCSFIQGIPQPAPKVKHCYYGAQYSVLRDEFARDPTIYCGPAPVFVCGGGSDPLDITRLICKALRGVHAVKQVHVVLGPFYRGCLDRGLNGEDPGFRIHRDVENPYELMARSSLAVVSYGMVALEALAAGLPTIAISISKDHLASAEALDREHSALISLGLISHVTVDRLEGVISELLTNESLRLQLAQSARRMIDGRGVERVANKIMETIR